MVQQFIRQTAYKVWISDLVSGEFVKGSGEFDADSLVVREQKVSRVNLIGVIVSKEDREGMFTVVIDDGSSRISSRFWGEDIRLIQEVELGDIILIIGRIRESNSVRYIVPEVVKKLSSTWMKCRNLELKKLCGEPIKVEVKDEELGPPQEVLTEEIVHEVVIDDLNEIRGNILSFIEENDGGEGVLIEEVVKSSGESAEKIVQELLKDGEIFEVRMGRLRILP